jgi:hypothetical protein
MRTFRCWSLTTPPITASPRRTARLCHIYDHQSFALCQIASLTIRPLSFMKLLIAASSIGRGRARQVAVIVGANLWRSSRRRRYVERHLSPFAFSKPPSNLQTLTAVSILSQHKQSEMAESRTPRRGDKRDEVAHILSRGWTAVPLAELSIITLKDSSQSPLMCESSQTRGI